MVDMALGLTLAFNGCVYNYRELRLELEGLGYRFASTGDTEVVLKAFRGELVPQDPNDEPAEQMLARLAASAETSPAKGKPGARKKRA